MRVKTNKEIAFLTALKQGDSRSRLRIKNTLTETEYAKIIKNLIERNVLKWEDLKPDQQPYKLAWLKINGQEGNYYSLSNDDKFIKIKAIIDDLGDKERDREKDQPLISATTAQEAIKKIWETIYKEE